MSRHRVDFNGLYNMFARITMQGDSSIVYVEGKKYGTALWGAPVKITGFGKVGLAGNGDKVFGFLHGVEKDGKVIIGKGEIQIGRSFNGSGVAVAIAEASAGKTFGANANNSLAFSATGNCILIAPALDYGAGYYYFEIQPAGDTTAP